jgi:uncharacterized protein
MTHAYALNGYYIVLDVYSGAIHLVDEVPLEAIRIYETHSSVETISHLLLTFPDHAELNACSAAELLLELDRLKAAGKLYTEDSYQGQTGKLKKDNTMVKALCLHVAHACNLSCSYCFAGQGKYQGQAALMSAEVGRKALDFLIAHSGSRRHLEVDFFGGEPLLNWGLVKELVGYGRELEKKHGKVFRFTMTTSAWIIRGAAAMSRSCRISAGLPKRAARKGITYAARSPTITLISSRTSCIWRIWGSPS